METSVKSNRTKTAVKKPVIKSSRSVAFLFGINKKEVDGLKFQKKIRNEWQ